MLTWRDVRVEPRHIPGYIPKSWVDIVEGDFHAVALRDIELDGRKYNSKGDTLEIFPENFLLRNRIPRAVG
jgi:cytochrome c-type biogenesis protein CcmF